MEKWSEIEGYARLYKVSNQGRVISLYGKGRIMKPDQNKNGHLNVTLTKDGKRTSFPISRLVAVAFIPCPWDAFCIVHHLDGDLQNNTRSNLVWRPKRGKDHPQAKLTEIDVLDIRGLAGTMSQREIGEIYNISREHVRDILQRKYWKHI